MSEQSGRAAAAIEGLRASLASRHGAAADADQVLSDALVSAHAAAMDGMHRLEALRAEIESAAQQHEALSVDTPLGAREFQKYLLAKQREIIAIVSDVATLSESKVAVLKSLQASYSAPADGA